MELNIKDRIYLPNILPKQGKYTEMLLVESIIIKTKIMSAEVSELGIVDNQDGSVSWQKDKVVDIAFTKEEIQILKNSASKLDEEGLVSMELLPLIKNIHEQ